jgi:hypothetical protein
MPKTLKQIRSLIRKAHRKEMKKQGVVCYNYGWVQDDDGICSKTSCGNLDTDYNQKTGRVTHRWC